MIDHIQDQLHLRGIDPLQGRKLFVRKRDARIEEFNEARISLAIESAFKAVASIGRDAKLPSQLQIAVKKCADAVAERVMSRAVRGEELEVERIQDAVEDQLMLDGHLEVARRYILYREQRRLARAEREGRIPSAVPIPIQPVSTLKTAASLAQVSVPAASPTPPLPPASPARVLLEKIYSQVLPQLQPGENLAEVHRRHFSAYTNEGQYLDLLAPELPEFDLDALAAALQIERDDLFPLSGLQVLHDGYLLEDQGRRIETPQYFWMRLAMGLAMNEGTQCTHRALEFYEALSTFRFVPSEIILAHAGTPQAHLLNTFHTTDWSDLEHVTAKMGPRLDPRKKSGLTCSWLEPWHIGIWDFLQRQLPGEPAWNHDLNKALWVPDLFMKRVRQNGRWTLFDPTEVPELHRKFGRVFEECYFAHEQKADRGELQNFQRINAVDLWQEILASLAQTGQPWFGFKDAANVRSTQDHAGMVHHGSICTGILLNSTTTAPVACSVGSINLGAHLTTGAAAALDVPLLQRTVATAMRMLDNAIEIHRHPTEFVRNTAQEHRPVALGLLGFQDALDKLNLPYASTAAADFADRSAEIVSHSAILASTALARERGVYPTYDGSKWSHGLLPVDTLALLTSERGLAVDIDFSSSQNWSEVREAVSRHGMRHGTTTGISTTDAGSQITGASPGIEPLRPMKQGEDAAAFKIGPEWLVECAARRQKWLDMSQAFGLYAANLDATALAEVYMQAWEKGLKTTRQLHLLAQPLDFKQETAAWSDQEKPRHSQREPVSVK